MSILNNVAVQWLIRRVPEWGGIIVTLMTFYNSMPEQHRQFITDVVSGQGGGLTIGAAIGFAMWVYAQIISFRATVKPETVTQTPDGTTVAVPTHYNTEAVEAGRTKPPRKTLWDIVRGN